MNKMNQYILLVGCTGVGKSTIYDFLCNTYKNHIAFADPYIANPFIADAYSEGNKSFQSQVFFFKEFLKIHKIISNTIDKIIIQERSIFESIEIFCKLFMHSGKMDLNEFLTMKDLLSQVEGWIRKPDVVLHIKADGKIIKKRIESRNREFEKDIDEKFILTQNKLYEEWLGAFCDNQNIKLIEIDNSQMSIDETNQSILALLQQV